MTSYRRFHVPGGTYFFTVHLQDRRSALLLEEIDILRAAYAACVSVQPFRTVSITVMPSHIHAIWQLPAGDSDYSTRWARIKALFSKRFSPCTVLSESQRAKGEKGIWQRRFWEHTIRDEADLDRHCRYCWTDPVRHGLVSDPMDWRYGSLHRDVASGLIDPAKIEPVEFGEFGE